MAGAVKGTKGAWGEECAAAYLRRRGYRILARNYSCRFGEIERLGRDNIRAILDDAERGAEPCPAGTH